MLPPYSLEQNIEKTVREEWGRILAALVKNLGDFELAEDSLQDAVEAALKHWHKNGLPNSPAAWLIQTARRKAIDRLRRSQNFAKKQPEISYLIDLDNMTTEERRNEVIPDKRLEMIFTCCHPALAEKTKIALTLRTLGGLTTEEIASAFLDKPKAMAQRLVRAKKKIKLAGIPYEIPGKDILPERLSSVLSVIYLIFNEGYSASSGNALTRFDLSEEAIRLARIMTQLMPVEREIQGLLALMLLHDARRYARAGKDGEFIPLEHQNRAIWDKGKAAEGTKILKSCLGKGDVGPYQLQAAISALHIEAVSWDNTDWPQIVALYDHLYALQPSPVIRINQALAVSYARSTKDALNMLDDVDANSNISAYQPYFAARADILQRDGQMNEASKMLKQAIALTKNDKQNAFLSEKLASL